MNKETVTVIYSLDNQEHSIDFEIDSSGYDEEDFQGGAAQEMLEEMLLKVYPSAELEWIERMRHLSSTRSR
jgi:hypothetical protein